MVRILQAGGVIRQWHVEREVLGTWETLNVPVVNLFIGCQTGRLKDIGAEKESTDGEGWRKR